MSFTYAVLGSGRQGSAAAFALARFFGASAVHILDLDAAAAARTAARVNALAGRDVARATAADAADPGALARLLAGVDAVISAVPYPLNPGAARAAIAAGAHFTDLGGNTDVVREELGLDVQAREAGVSVVPDSGLAPGLSNALAALALARIPAARAVRMWCGGLPVEPKGPLGYKLVFHIGGLTNEYTGKAVVLRGGQRMELDAFTEPEEVEFPPPVGRAEAFLTSGGTSTCPETWTGKLETLEYKTVRYPGHYAMMRPLIALGFLDTGRVAVGTGGIVPRDLAHVLIARHIQFPDDPDLVVLRVVASDGKRELRFELLDRQDADTGFTAMERCTAFPAAALAHLQAGGGVEPGARRLETAFDPQRYFELVRATGLPIEVSERAL